MASVSSKKSGEMTPLMKQFWDIKAFHHDKILLFRMGDFFEMFYDDAVKAAPIIGIALTQRNKKSEDSTPMCGVPHHSIAGPINKLLAAGLKIAICDQIEDPKLAKGLVKRAVTRVLTPGMVFDSETLDQTKAHYVCAIHLDTMSFIDTTTGEAFYYDVRLIQEKLRLIDILPVAEIVVTDAGALWLKDSRLSDRYLISEHAVSVSDSQSLLLDYIKKLSVSDVEFILQPFEKREIQHRLGISQTTLRHLEVFSNYKGGEQGSLFKAIDRTKTSAGSRMLRQWLSFPLRNTEQIQARQEKITLFRDNMMELKKVREILVGMGDIERRMGKIAQPQCHGRDLLSLANSLKIGLQALKWCDKFFTFDHADSLSEVAELADQIERTIDDEAPLTVKLGHVIKKGFSNELDELIHISTNAHALVAQLEQKEKESTGISSLKVRYNNVFGYYIEITNTHKDKAPAHYHRKQTLANAERFYTDELLELEKKVLSAQTKRFELEFEIYMSLRVQVLNAAEGILKLASICNEMDVVSSLAWLSLEESYCRPVFTTDKKKLLLQDSRHAVVEQFIRGQFVANTISMDHQDCFLITGPNMAGKSTLMRQVALTVILAQMGSYVPATHAELPLYDAIYTRIGASDQLSEGLSTFMVEMTETAQLLNAATENSLLILDEIGRGTATFDGLCLAQAILEYILSHLKTHVFFATHYHELTVLDQKFPQIKNKYMQVLSKENGQIEFLHILTSGAVGQSYGVQVAELAGLPREIIQRATSLLKTFETPEVNKVVSKKTSTNQMSLFEAVKVELDPEKQQLINELKTFSVLKTSPLEALNQIAKWQEKLI
ncbi:MAG: DNA mismatch repair protein MutS [Bdellovibrionales bacterium RIFCSPHIGHO2_01_FULL_40_29]|nr:MAG: DNA mismatch repair protein MutS [Bdellovibrionales bacterium RIFCSPHIGHO2_01_FULL_40_29]OFZ35622.1 MAG: DNA mismatch repair protein MutS [Bdellovibrionales bacterium RIFCSPHIGHO2_02_FULL_40_15]